MFCNKLCGFQYETLRFSVRNSAVFDLKLRGFEIETVGAPHRTHGKDTKEPIIFN